MRQLRIQSSSLAVSALLILLTLTSIYSYSIEKSDYTSNEKLYSNPLIINNINIITENNIIKMDNIKKFNTDLIIDGYKDYIEYKISNKSYKIFYAR